MALCSIQLSWTFLPPTEHEDVHKIPPWTLCWSRVMQVTSSHPTLWHTVYSPLYLRFRGVPFRFFKKNFVRISLFPIVWRYISLITPSHSIASVRSIYFTSEAASHLVCTASWKRSVVYALSTFEDPTGLWRLEVRVYWKYNLVVLWLWRYGLRH
jgi:hypothetical protein